MTIRSNQYTAETLNYEGKSDNGILALEVAKDLAMHDPSMKETFKSFFDNMDAHMEACLGGCHSSAYGVVASVKEMLNARDAKALQCVYCGYSDVTLPCPMCGY